MRDRHANLLYRLRRTLQASAGTVADADLLDRYARGGDQATFELLLWRHGPMVWGVCRRVLGHTQDAEDAFQAAFLALTRRAHTLHDGAALAAWLYRVAHRTALAAQTNSKRRANLAQTAAALPGRTPSDPARTVSDRELAALLDDEIARLPERLRLPFILCQLEGRDRAEAAAELHCPVGTVDSRLHRARNLLAARLARRGVALPAVGVIVVPAALRAATLKHVAAPVASLPALILAEKTLRTLAVGTFKKCLTAALAACLVVSGVGLAARRPPAAGRQAESAPSRPAAQTRKEGGCGSPAPTGRGSVSHRVAAAAQGERAALFARKAPPAR